MLSSTGCDFNPGLPEIGPDVGLTTESLEFLTSPAFPPHKDLVALRNNVLCRELHIGEGLAEDPDECLVLLRTAQREIQVVANVFAGQKFIGDGEVPLASQAIQQA